MKLACNLILVGDLVSCEWTERLHTSIHTFLKDYDKLYRNFRGM